MVRGTWASWETARPSPRTATALLGAAARERPPPTRPHVAAPAPHAWGAPGASPRLAGAPRRGTVAAGNGQDDGGLVDGGVIPVKNVGDIATISGRISSEDCDIPVIAPSELRASLLASEDLWSTTVHARIKGASATDADAAPSFRLAYMPMRNRAEVPRMMLELSETPYEFECVGFVPWKRDVKPRAARERFGGSFGKLPVLVDLEVATRDGTPLRLGQEAAITRHLARRLGMDGGDDVAAHATLDSLYALYFCTMRNNGVTHEGEQYAAGALRDAPEGLTNATKPTTYRAMRRVNDFSVAERSMATLGFFEELVSSSDTGWLAGAGSPTYVDVALFVELLELSEPCHVPDFAERFELPGLGAFVERLLRRRGIAMYLDDAYEGRMPRYERPGYTYVAG